MGVGVVILVLDSESGWIAKPATKIITWRLRNSPALTLGREHSNFTMTPLASTISILNYFVL